MREDASIEPPLVARAIAPQLPARPDGEPPHAATADGPQWPALTPRRTLPGMQSPAAAMSAAAAPLHQIVAREVARQIAAIKPPPASPVTSAPSKRAVPALDVASDDVVRRLLSKMRTMSQEERFRGGLLR